MQWGITIVSNAMILFEMCGQRCVQNWSVSNCNLLVNVLNTFSTQIGSFEDSEKITRAVNLHNEIYILMANGKFGNLKAEPECSLRLLRSVQNASSSFGPILIVDWKFRSILKERKENGNVKSSVNEWMPSMKIPKIVSMEIISNENSIICRCCYTNFKYS